MHLSLTRATGGFVEGYLLLGSCVSATDRFTASRETLSGQALYPPGEIRPYSFILED